MRRPTVPVLAPEQQALRSEREVLAQLGLAILCPVCSGAAQYAISDGVYMDFAPCEYCDRTGMVEAADTWEAFERMASVAARTHGLDVVKASGTLARARLWRVSAPRWSPRP